MNNKEISNNDDVIDSRDVIKRIEELQDEKDEFIINESMIDENESPSWGDIAEANANAESKWDESEEGEELKVLLALAEQAESYASDWQYGEQLIRDSYFKEYAKEFAWEIDAIDKDSTWPNNCIDWEQAANELQSDYTSIEFDGVTYWIR